MSRRSRAEKRVVEPDPRFESTTATKFINNLMLDGKKSIAESIFYDALDMAEERSGQPGMNVFRQAGPGGEEPARRRRDVPGAHRGPAGAAYRPGDPVADILRPSAAGEDDGRATRW